MSTVTISVVIIITVLGVLGIASGFASERKEHKPEIMERDLLAREELEAKLDRLERIKGRKERQHND